MFASALIVIPVALCGAVGGLVGYFYRYRVGLRRVFTVAAAVFIFLIVEVTSGTLSGKYSLQENLSVQPDLLGPFFILYLLPAVSTSFLIARQWRQWQ
ncbi:MAG: hypothetical protein ABR514_01970 [Chthoniobacterales bacterium]